MRSALLAAALALVPACQVVEIPKITTTSSTSDGVCEPGEVGCVCNEETARCDEGLLCSGGICVAPEEESTGGGTSGESASESGSSGSTGDSEASTSTTGSDETTGGESSSSGSSTGAASASSTGDETTGPPEPFCGDGFKNPGEECDDGNSDDDDGCYSDCKLPCVPSGERVPFDLDLESESTGCRQGNPCAYDAYDINEKHSLSLVKVKENLLCSTFDWTPQCVGHVGITTHKNTSLGQGRVDVFCDFKAVGTIDTFDKACGISATAGPCRTDFPPRLCHSIRLVAADPQQANENGYCAGAPYIDMVLNSVSAW